MGSFCYSKKAFHYKIFIFAVPQILHGNPVSVCHGWNSPDFCRDSRLQSGMRIKHVSRESYAPLVLNNSVSE